MVFFSVLSCCCCCSYYYYTGEKHALVFFATFFSIIINRSSVDGERSSCLSFYILFLPVCFVCCSSASLSIDWFFFSIFFCFRIMLILYLEYYHHIDSIYMHASNCNHSSKVSDSHFILFRLKWWREKKTSHKNSTTLYYGFVQHYRFHFRILRAHTHTFFFSVMDYE